MKTHHQHFKFSKGFILLPVVFTLTILAAVAYLLSREGAMNAGNVNREQQQDVALYTAQAGYNHAVWQLNQQKCVGYADIPSTSFGNYAYSTELTDTNGVALTAGSPVNIKVEVEDASIGKIIYAINRYQVKTYDDSKPPQPFQPDAAEGKDTWVTASQSSNNYGTTSEMVISGGASPKHFLSKFDISSISSGSKVISAKFEMYLGYISIEDPAGKFSIYRMLEDWAEGSGDSWNPGDGANWNTSDGSTAWLWDSNHDTDNIVADASVKAGFSGWHEWDISSLVQNWVSDASSNFGLLVKGNENVTGAGFYSSDSGSNRPRLTIIYACECGDASCDPVPPEASCNGTFRDEFNNRVYSGNDGTLNWADDWLEINESDGPDAGDEMIMDDSGHSSLRLRDNDGGGEGVEREADLSGASSATLSLLYRRQELDNIDDRVTLFISANGSSGPWSELVFFAGGGSDSDYVSFSLDISSFISANTRIRLLTSASMGNKDEVYFDDIQIQCSP